AIAVQGVSDEEQSYPKVKNIGGFFTANNAPTNIGVSSILENQTATNAIGGKFEVRANSSVKSARGVSAYAENSNLSNIGVLSTGAGGNVAIGVQGSAFNGVANIGVLGEVADTSGSNYAGYFNG